MNSNCNNNNQGRGKKNNKAGAFVAMRKAKRLEKKNFNQLSSQNDRYAGAVTRIGRGKLASVHYDPTNKTNSYMAKIPLSCKNVARLSREFEIHQEYCNMDMEIDISSGFPQTSGGMYRYGVVLDALDAADETYDNLIDMISSSPVNGKVRFVANKKIVIKREVFRNTRDEGWRYTTSGMNPRMSEIGYLYIVAEADPTAANILTIDVRANIMFRQPSVESAKSNGFFTTELYGKSGTNHILPLKLHDVEAVTILDIRTEYPDLPQTSKVLKLASLGNATYKVGAGDICTVGFHYLLFNPDASGKGFFTPIMVDKDGLLAVRNDNFDHADAADTYKIVIPGNTGFDAVGDTISDVNYSLNKHKGYIRQTTVDDHGNIIVKVVKNNISRNPGTGPEVENPRRVVKFDDDLLMDDDVQARSLATNYAPERGPYPPTEDSMKIDSVQFAQLTDLGESNHTSIAETKAEVLSQHSATRSSLEASIFAQTTAMTAAVEFEANRNRLHVDTVNAGIAAGVATVEATTGSTLSRVQTISNNVDLATSKQNEMSEIQNQDSQRSLATYTKVDGILMMLERTEGKVDSYHEVDLSRFTRVDKTHDEIISLINAIPKFNNYDAVANVVDRMRIAFNNPEIAVFRSEFNLLLTMFGLANVTPNEYDCVLTHEKMVEYMRTGNLFPYNSGSDVPMEESEKPNYVWPNYNVAAPEDLVGLYLRTQRANLEGLEEYGIYTYFRIDSTSDGKMFMTQHTAGEPALPR